MALTLAPGQYDTVLKWACWLRSQGRHTDVEPYLQKAIRLKLDSLLPILALVDIYCITGRAEKAMSLLVAQAQFTASLEAEQIQQQRELYIARGRDTEQPITLFDINR